MKTCTVDDCDRKHEGRGLCHMHLQRVQRHGDTKKLVPRAPGGTQHHNWSGDAVTYSGAHIRTRRARGKASEHRCVFNCGKQAEQWAYDHHDPNELRDEQGRVYSADPNHYQAMCRSCHGGLDWSKRP